MAVSACLAGASVRWDGTHQGDDWPRQAAEALFALRGICPEVGIGMGVPRPPIGLQGSPRRPRVVLAPGRPPAAGDIDFAPRLRRFAESQADVLRGVHGYIFAARSPSCGLADVKVFRADGTFRRTGQGVYAAAVLAAHPCLPVVEAQQLASVAPLLEFALAVAARAGRDVGAAALERRIAALFATAAGGDRQPSLSAHAPR